MMDQGPRRRTRGSDRYCISAFCSAVPVCISRAAPLCDQPRVAPLAMATQDPITSAVRLDSFRYQTKLDHQDRYPGQLLPDRATRVPRQVRRVRDRRQDP